ncbi:GntR family transcriptional regulator [Dethiosulfatarculus sandiegensis]|uniref:HTH gntR-type domain-containing protein n=1 Tax=Dethiosulfatarculus sandiegensis TaxID=1429043 RepID=A0A0D2J3F6_9BACT|nr:GntR family transcriptional regulator [Dethiosulfatarculus sandiegensis]KIX12729.1 hypothetical protein X474_17635 [Dethiosulfatarculus sandiegensis]
MSRMVARPKRLGEQVTDFLREMIVKGELSPGYRLKEEEVARVMGASRTPVREALHRLEQESFLIRRKKGGYLVGDITDRDLKDAFDLKCVLMEQALKKVLERAGRREILELKSLFMVWSRARSQNDPHANDQAEEAFVEELCRVAGSRLLARLLNELSQTLTQFEAALPKGDWIREAGFLNGQSIFQRLSSAACERGSLRVRDRLWEEDFEGERAIG